MIAGASAAPTLPPASPPFDPSRRLGALGDWFQAGVYELADRFIDKERALGEHLVTRHGASVHRRPEDHTKQGVMNPDAIVRCGPDDPGRVTEFKTLDKPTSSAVKNDIIRAGGQLADYGGDAVLDGRGVGLPEEVARRGYARAAGQARQHGQPMPQRVRIILGDGRTIDLGEGTT